MSATPNIRGEKIFGSITGITLFSATTISGGTFYGNGSNLTGIVGGSGSSITGGTFDKNTSTLTFTNTTGGTFSVTGLTDVYVTGGTYDNNTGTATFTNTSGGTFNVSGFTTGSTSNLAASGITYNNSISNLTATTIQNAIDEIVLRTPIVLAQSSPNSTRSGDTNNTLMYSKLINANVVEVNDGLQITTKFTKPSGSLANPTVRLYVNTSSDLSGASLLATYLTTNLNGRFFLVERTANVDGATTNLIAATSGALTDSASLSTAAPSDVSIDWTLNQYFIVAIQLGNAADSTTLRMVNVTLNKNI